MKYTHKEDYHVTTKQKSALLNTVGSHTNMHTLMKKPKFKVVQFKKNMKTSRHHNLFKIIMNICCRSQYNNTSL